MSKDFHDEIRLGDFLYIKARIGWKGLTAKEYTESGAFLIAGTHIVRDKIEWNRCQYISMERYNESPEIKLREEDVIISKDGTIGRVAFVEKLFGPTTINGTMMLIRPNDKNVIFPKFIYYVLQSEPFQNLVKEKISGSSIPHIFQRDIVKFKVNKPDINEQKKIAEILTSVDRVIELTSQEIDKLKDLRFSYVEANLNPDNQKWKVVSIANILDKGKNSMRGGPFGSNLLKEEWTTSGIPYLGIDNIQKESFNSNFKRYVTEKKFNELKVYSVFEGDVVITIMGTIGRSCVIPTGFKHLLSSKHLRSMTLDQSKYIPTLLCYQLNYSSWVWRQYRAGQQGGIMDAINNDVLKELKICCPPMNEQKKMNDFLVQLKHKIDLKTEYLDSITSLKKGLMNDLLTGKTRVKCA